MICNMRVNAAILTVYRDIFAGGEKKFFDHFFARPGRILKCFFKIKPCAGCRKKKYVSAVDVTSIVSSVRGPGCMVGCFALYNFSFFLQGVVSPFSLLPIAPL